MSAGEHPSYYPSPGSDRGLTEAICSLTCILSRLGEQLENENKLVLKRIEQKVDDMAIKLSEVKGEVSGLRTQVKKIWDEQQTRYDALVVKYDALAGTLANQELDSEATAEVEAFKADLKGFDDTIPDTTA